MPTVATPIPSVQMSTKTVVFLQDACFRHRYIRSRETSAHVERPERLHAVKLGLAAAIARLEELLPLNFPISGKRTSGSDHDRATADDLADALDRMNLVTDIPKLPVLLVPIINSSASVDVSNHPAVKFAHDDAYLENIILWARESQVKIAAGLSEIPKKLSQTDLYREFTIYYLTIGGFLSII
jgi:histone deacetylase HOS3